LVFAPSCCSTRRNATLDAQEETQVTRSLSLPILQPRTYGDCVTGTPLTGTLEERMSGRRECSNYTCRHALRVVRSENVPGRRNNGVAPEWTLDSEAIAAAPSCALDVANRGAHKCSELASMEGKSKRRIQQEVKGAMHSLRDALVGIGEDPQAVYEWMLALMKQEGEE
jgi:hypothetical protein